MINVYKPNTKKWYLLEIFRYMEIVDCRDDFQYYKNRLMYLTNSKDNGDRFMRRMRKSLVYSFAELFEYRSIYVRLLTEYFNCCYYTGRRDFSLPIQRFPLFKIKDIYFTLRDCVMYM